MRKLILIVIATLSLQACSVTDFLPTPTSTSTPTSSPTPTNTPTRTLTPTRTITPTLQNTVTIIPAVLTYTPLVIPSPVALTSIFSPTPLTPLGGFESIEITQGKIYYGICKHNYTKMTVKVEHPEAVRKVYLFFRLETAKPSGKTTPWTGTITDNDGGGFFIYTLRANNIPERKNFIKAWVHYQFVAEDYNQEIIGRTQIYTRTLILEPCR